MEELWQRFSRMVCALSRCGKLSTRAASPTDCLFLIPKLLCKLYREYLTCTSVLIFLRYYKMKWQNVGVVLAHTLCVVPYSRSLMVKWSFLQRPRGTVQMLSKWYIGSSSFLSCCGWYKLSLFSPSNVKAIDFAKSI